MSGFPFPRSMLVACGACLLALTGAMPVHAQEYGAQDVPAQSAPSGDQAPGRVARLAYLSGDVQFSPAGEDDWGSTEVNRPMVIGDRLVTGDDGLAVLELGDASVRLDHGSAFDFLNLDTDNVQIELSQGTLNAAVRQMGDGENFEVDTPTVAFVAAGPGEYRIDDNPSGTGTMVTVFRGSGTVYGENGASYPVADGTSYRFNDSTLASVDVTGVPAPDDFDRFCEARDANYARYAEQQQPYVPPDMIGGDELGAYGAWDAVPEYGNVWYPTSIPVGWAPYRYGHWAWIDPWGWTWIDNQPWGFAPFHYGRWAYIGHRWGWIPGPRNLRPVYAPALVAFIGGSGFALSVNLGGAGPVGWFPLGPRDVYVPWFRASRGYFTNVNITNIRNVYVNRTVINNIYVDYSRNQYANINRYNRYAYRNVPGAVTAVPRNVFTGARPVHPAILKLDRTRLARASVAVRPGVTPDVASLGVRQPVARPAVLRGREPFARPVVARHQPPPRQVAFAARERMIAGQHGEPLTTAQLRGLHAARPATDSEKVRLVPARAAAPARATPVRGAVAGRPTEGIAPVRNPAARPVRAPETLPSARFAHPVREPGAAVVRPGSEQRATPPGRLPVVRPLTGTPQPLATEQQQRQMDMQARQRDRTQQAQQRRQLQQQAQQGVRAQQAEQRRAMQATPQQRAQDRQLQQQRDVQVEAEQRARTQQAQQQRRVEQQAQQQRESQMRTRQYFDIERARQQQQVQRTEQAQPEYRGRPVQHAPPRSGQHPVEHRTAAPPKKPAEASGSGNG